jgi:hypothetical protein
MTDNVVRLTHNAFMQGKNILNGMVILHEKFHKLQWNKMNGVIFKFDFKKQHYNSIFLQTPGMKGFSQEWHAWIYNFAFGDTATVKSKTMLVITHKQQKVKARRPITHTFEPELCYPPCAPSTRLPCWDSAVHLLLVLF